MSEIALDIRQIARPRRRRRQQLRDPVMYGTKDPEFEGHAAARRAAVFF
jgi:hypothetical protein